VGARHSTSAEVEHKRFLNSARWRKFRAWFLSQPENVLCAEPGCNHLATVVDHRLTRRERPDLAFEPCNCVGYCQRHHNAKTARRDGGFGNPVQGGGRGPGQ
jgi:5-methylcytosine-specific restriction protein A